jgi:hypothetical protein
MAVLAKEGQGYMDHKSTVVIVIDFSGLVKKQVSDVLYN